jgi:AraC-like DNA-binding protein
MPVKDETLASVGQILWRLIELHDLSPEPLFRAAGIDPQLIHDPHARIARPNGDALTRALAERMANPAFGLQAAQCWHPSNLGTLGYAWLSSATLRTALKRLVRYWRIVIADVTVRLDETPEGVEFVHTPPALDAALDWIRGDIVMAMIYDMCRTNWGQAFSPRRVAFRHTAPADAGPYEALFGCPVSFGADANRLLVGTAEADHPLPTGNQDLAAAHDRILVEQLARLDKTNVVARFRSSLLGRMTSGEFSEEDVARDLHMSRRSLQRRLSEADASYQSLVDGTRRDMALRYIEDPAKSATDITFLLGYSQQSAFTRAFRRWTGMSPSEYRSSKSATTA